MTNASRLKRLSEAADKCHAHCSDYSCVRSNQCTGHAGHEYDRERRRQEAERQEDEADRALAATLNRLKRKGLI